MELLDAEFVQRCEGLRRAAAGRPMRRFLGRKFRRTLAGGTEATDVSDYSTGNDYRYVDWNRAARLDELVTKHFHGREDHDVYFLLDASGSMKLAGDGAASKFDFARRLIGALAYLALKNRDRIAVCSFAEQLDHATRRLSGERAVPELWDFLNGLTTGGAKTDFGTAVRKFVEQNFRPGLVVVISDLFDPAGFDRPFDLLRSYGHELFVVHLLSPLDAEPAVAGKYKLINVETGSRRGTFVDAEDLKNYREVFGQFCASVDRYCRRHHVGKVRLTTDVPVEEAVEQMLRFGRTVS
jgi:uncharacterized protein (DUF58 family)